MTCDCLILGGGVIGLSLAYELSGCALRVQVIERGMPGQEASWAGAGILPPASLQPTGEPLERLAALSFRLHEHWSRQLHKLTGIDNGYRRCGGLYLSRCTADEADLLRAAHIWRQQGISAERVDASALRELEPALFGGDQPSSIRSAWHLPDECQLRNPRHLRALLSACELRGVTITPGTSVDDFVVEDSRVVGVRTSAGMLSAGAYVVCSGAWTQVLLARLGVRVAVKPIRGQMVLLTCAERPIARVLNEGRRYLVPRDDGRVLAGSTEEDVGFDKRNTGAAVEELLQFAMGLVPALADAQFERCWAGLRPGTVDGLPYLGPLPDLANAFVAAGHFRSGLYLSPGTAVVMAELIRGQRPSIDLTAFRVGRDSS